jgi:hypothetical protein
VLEVLNEPVVRRSEVVDDEVELVHQAAGHCRSREEGIRQGTSQSSTVNPGTRENSVVL